MDIPGVLSDPEAGLYALLDLEDSDSAHSRYNALVRRLVSFERAAERAMTADSLANASPSTSE